MNSLDDYIMTIDDMLPQALIDDLLDEYKTSNEWLSYTKGARGGKEPATAILISHPKIIRDSARRKQIHNDIATYLGKAFDQYHARHSRRDQGLNFLDVRKLVGLRLIKYKKGQSLAPHTDKYTDPDSGLELWPAVTFTLNLNSNFSGGDLVLLDGALRFKPVANQCVLFPANFLYPHAVETVTRGIRYALVGWFI